MRFDQEEYYENHHFAEFITLSPLIATHLLITPLCLGVDFAFASYYQDNMVLQRAPVRATMWGYGYTVDEQVDVTIVVDGVTKTYSVMTNEGISSKYNCLMV